MAVQEYRLVSHQSGQPLSFFILTAIPNEVSFTEVPSAHQTSKEPFHESLLLVLVERGLTAGVDCGYFGFGFKRGDEGAGEVEVLFHRSVEMRLLLRMRWCTKLKIKLNLSCTKSWVFGVKLESSIDWIMDRDYSYVFFVPNRLEIYLALHSLVNLLFELNSIEHFERHNVSLQCYPSSFWRVLR